MPGGIRVHGPGPADNYCWSHHREENARRAYKVCPECFHVFRTAEDLANDFLTAHDGMMAHPEIPAPKPHEIFACPWCGHDF